MLAKKVGYLEKSLEQNISQEMKNISRYIGGLMQHLGTL